MRQSAICFLLFAGILAAPATASDPKNSNGSTSQAEMDKSCARGRLLYEYDQAAWHATDALIAAKPDTSRFNMYVARKNDDGWVVSWGKLNESKDAFVIAYKVRFPGTDWQSPQVQVLDSGEENSGFEFFAARAISDALTRFGQANRPYNAAVLPTENGLFVYFIPAQTTADIFPLGGDVRYAYSADGNSFVEKRQMHQSVLEMKVDPNTVARFHTHVLSDTLEDSDFYYALAEGRAEMIITEQGLIQLDPKGAIKISKK